MIKDAIIAATYDKLESLFKLLAKLLLLEDSVVEDRVAGTVRDLLIIFEDKKKLPKSTESNLAFLVHKLYEKNRFARAYLDNLYKTTTGTPNDPLDWIEQWLLRYTLSMPAHVPGKVTPPSSLQAPVSRCAYTR